MLTAARAQSCLGRYTQPTTLSLAEASSPEKQEKLKALPSFFDAEWLHTQQLRATSADGTEVGGVHQRSPG